MLWPVAKPQKKLRWRCEFRVTVCGFNPTSLFFFFFNDPPTTEIYPLPLHDALPIYVRSEYVVRVTGTVRHRPEGTTNAELATGEVEVGDCDVEILNVAEPPPFPLHDRVDTDENVRLKYRYVDIRRERMQRNLRVRAAVNA